MIKLTDLEFQKHKHNLNSDHYSTSSQQYQQLVCSSYIVISSRSSLLGQVQKIQNAVTKKKINNEKLSFYHNLSSPNQKIGKISIMENFERLRSPAARLRFARLTLVRLGLNDGVKLWVSFKLCFKTNDFYSRG